MTYEPAEEAAFRQRLLSSPGERQDVDYKASKGLGSDDVFTLKLVRHIQGMTNAGGGWLVIGYLETPNGFSPDPSHTDAIAATYDPTRLVQLVNSSVSRGQQVSLSVYQERHPATGLRYPVIQILGITTLPVVCRSSKESRDTGDAILKQGAVYLRRVGAETSEVSTPADWEDIISRCMRLRREEFLAEFTDLFQRMMSPSVPSVPATTRLDNVLTASRARALGLGGAAP